MWRVVKKINHFGKLDRSAPVYVCTHNVRAQSVNDSDDNAIFLDPLVSPANNEFHPLFRPVSEEFLNVVHERLEMDEKVGFRAMNNILQTWINEVDENRKIGGGVTSFEKLSGLINFGDKVRKIVCNQCHAV